MQFTTVYKDKDFLLHYIWIDNEKNLALYVDKITTPSKEVKNVSEKYSKNKKQGNLITYIPYEQIKYIQLQVK